MIDAGDSLVAQESSRESPFKDRYFVIAWRFKDPAQVKGYLEEWMANGGVPLQGYSNCQIYWT